MLTGLSTGNVMSTSYQVVIGTPLSGQAATQALIADTVKAAGMWLGSYVAGWGDIAVLLSFDPNIATMNGGSSANRDIGLVSAADGRSYRLLQDSVIAEILQGVDINGAGTDASINVGTTNLDRYYWFDSTLATAGDIPQDKTDGFRVILHELLHAMGFNGWLANSQGDYNGSYISVFDQFVVAAEGRSFFTGASAVAAFGSPVPLTNVHLGDNTSFAQGLLRGDTTLMSYDYVPNGSRISLDPVVIGILRDMGYTVRDTQAAFTGTGEALNTAVIGTSSAGFDIVKTLDLTWLSFTGRSDFSYLLTNEQRLQFTDLNVALDTGKDEVGGQAYRMYQAAFARTPDAGGLGFWIRAMDSGFDVQQVAAMFIDSNEFRSAYGSSFSNDEIVRKLYQNILQRPGDAGGIAFWVNVLDTRAATLAQVLAGFSESDENVDGMAALIGEGFSYLPYGA